MSEYPKLNPWATYRGKPIVEMDTEELRGALADIVSELRLAYFEMTPEQMKAVAKKTEAYRGPTEIVFVP